MGSKYLSREEAVKLLRRERERYPSLSEMARAWGISRSMLDRIMREGRIGGHAAKQLGLKPVTLYTRD
jgi:DNA invertase Pin-like site-specific DNA recombinase